MARAITQNFAWAAAFVLSGLTFAGVLSFVFLAAPAKHAATSADHGHGDAHGESGDHGKADEHGDAHAKADSQGDTKADDHGKAKSHGDDTHAPSKPASTHGEDEEISAKDFKKKAAPEAAEHEAPHH